MTRNDTLIQEDLIPVDGLMIHSLRPSQQLTQTLASVITLSLVLVGVSAKVHTLLIDRCFLL